MSESITLEPSSPATHSIIWLHGLGAFASDFANVAQVLDLPSDCAVRHICPQAPMQSVTLNQGMVMPAWYDLHAIEFSAKEDRWGIQQAFDIVKDLIKQETKRGISSKNVFIAGFSMGGALALYSGLCYHQPLGGIIALSAYLPLARDFPTAAKARPDLPIFLGYGTKDDLVLPEWTTAIATNLAAMGYTACSIHGYPMGHMVCGEELRDLSGWLGGVLRKP